MNVRLNLDAMAVDTHCLPVQHVERQRLTDIFRKESAVDTGRRSLAVDNTVIDQPVICYTQVGIPHVEAVGQYDTRLPLISAWDLIHHGDEHVIASELQAPVVLTGRAVVGKC